MLGSWLLRHWALYQNARSRSEASLFASDRTLYGVHMVMEFVEYSVLIPLQIPQMRHFVGNATVSNEHSRSPRETDNINIG